MASVAPTSATPSAPASTKSSPKPILKTAKVATTAKTAKNAAPVLYGWKPNPPGQTFTLLGKEYTGDDKTEEIISAALNFNMSKPPRKEDATAIYDSIYLNNCGSDFNLILSSKCGPLRNHVFTIFKQNIKTILKGMEKEERATPVPVAAAAGPEAGAEDEDEDEAGSGAAAAAGSGSGSGGPEPGPGVGARFGAAPGDEDAAESGAFLPPPLRLTSRPSPFPSAAATNAPAFPSPGPGPDPAAAAAAAAAEIEREIAALTPISLADARILKQWAFLTVNSAILRSGPDTTTIVEIVEDYKTKATITTGSEQVLAQKKAFIAGVVADVVAKRELINSLTDPATNKATVLRDVRAKDDAITPKIDEMDKKVEEVWEEKRTPLLAKAKADYDTAVNDAMANASKTLRASKLTITYRVAQIKYGLPVSALLDDVTITGFTSPINSRSFNDLRGFLTIDACVKRLVTTEKIKNEALKKAINQTIIPLSNDEYTTLESKLTESVIEAAIKGVTDAAVADKAAADKAAEAARKAAADTAARKAAAAADKAAAAADTAAAAAPAPAPAKAATKSGNYLVTIKIPLASLQAFKASAASTTPPTL